MSREVLQKQPELFSEEEMDTLHSGIDAANERKGAGYGEEQLLGYLDNLDLLNRKARHLPPSNGQEHAQYWMPRIDEGWELVDRGTFMRVLPGEMRDNALLNDLYDSIFTDSEWTKKVESISDIINQQVPELIEAEISDKVDEEAKKAFESLEATNVEAAERKSAGFASTEQKYQDLLDEYGLSPSDATEQLHMNPELRQRVTALLQERLEEMLEWQPDLKGYVKEPSDFGGGLSPKLVFGDRIVSNSAGNIKQDPKGRLRLPSREMAAEYALRMLDGRWDYSSEDSMESTRYMMKYGAGPMDQRFEEPVVGQHRMAARTLLARDRDYLSPDHKFSFSK